MQFFDEYEEDCGYGFGTKIVIMFVVVFGFMCFVSSLLPSDIKSDEKTCITNTVDK